MKRVRIKLLALLAALCWCPLLFGQAPAPTLAQFKISIQTIQSNSPLWRKTINSVNVETLPVAYATGKVYDQGKRIVNEDLDVLLLLEAR